MALKFSPISNPCSLKLANIRRKPILDAPVSPPREKLALARDRLMRKHRPANIKSNLRRETIIGGQIAALLAGPMHPHRVSRGVSRSLQEGASGSTAVDSEGCFSGVLSVLVLGARCCIVYDIYSDVSHGRCCARCSFSPSRNCVSISVYALYTSGRARPL